MKYNVIFYVDYDGKTKMAIMPRERIERSRTAKQTGVST
jgi:hypothetical protein